MRQELSPGRQVDPQFKSELPLGGGCGSAMFTAKRGTGTANA